MQVSDGTLYGLADGPQHRPLVVPEEIRGTENHAGDGDGTVEPMRFEGSEQDQELADEPVSAGQSDRGQSDQQEKRREQRGLFGHSAKSGELCRLLSGVEKTRDKEESGRAEAQIDHGQQASLKSLIVQREEADYNKPQVADATVGEQSPKIWLNEGHDRAVEDRSKSQDHDDRNNGLALRGFRQERNAEAHEPEGAELEPRQHDSHADRAFQQGVGQPGVKGEDRCLKREAEKHEPEDQDLLIEWNRNREQLQQIERVRL